MPRESILHLRHKGKGDKSAQESAVFPSSIPPVCKYMEIEERRKNLSSVYLVLQIPERFEKAGNTSIR